MAFKRISILFIFIFIICSPVYSESGLITEGINAVFDCGYRTAGFFVPYNYDGSSCDVQFREIGRSWKKGYASNYDTELGGFGGALTMLKPGAAYEVYFEIFQNGYIVRTFSEEFRTKDARNMYPKAEKNKISLSAAFESCGYYIPYDKGNAECIVKYKKETDENWTDAYPPIYSKESEEFRGSIVKLSEGADYEIKADIIENGAVKKSFENTFSTRKTDVKIAKTIPLSEIYSDGSLLLYNLHGSGDGYIKIQGDGKTVIKTEFPEAVLISNCSYLILDSIIIKGGTWGGINIAHNTNDVRIINCDISEWGTPAAGQDSVNGKFVNERGETANNTAPGIAINDSLNTVIDRCYIHDSKGKDNAWMGSFWASTHPSGPVGIFSGGTDGLVIRYCDITGSNDYRLQDAISGMDNGSMYGGMYKDSEIYGNLLAFGQDDGIETDGGQMNLRFFNNKIIEFYAGISTAPNMLGPAYFYNNLIFDLFDEYDRTVAGVKNGGGPTYSKGMTYFFHNTFYINANAISGIGFGEDPGDLRRLFNAVSRNNLMMTTKWTNGVSDILKNDLTDFDYDFIGNLNGGGAAWNAKDGSEKNSIRGLADFVDIKSGDFRLKPDSTGTNSGQIIPNFSDGYSGTAPDMGACESGDGAVFPKRPLLARADKYKISLTGNIAEELSLSGGKFSESIKFEIKKGLDMEWLNVSAPKNELLPNETLKLNIVADPSKFSGNNDMCGTLLIKFEDGFSIPVAIYAKKQEIGEISDNFEQYKSDTVPNDWFTLTGGGGDIKITDINENKALEINDKSTASTMMLKREFAQTSNKKIFEFKLKSMQTSGGGIIFYINNSDGVSAAAYGVNANGQIFACNFDQRLTLMPYTENEWYHFKLEIRPYENTFDLYINNKKIMDNEKCWASVDTISNFYINTILNPGGTGSSAGTGIFYIDDFSISN